MCANKVLRLGVHKKITNPEAQQMIADIQQLTTDKARGIDTPKPSLQKWNKPIEAKIDV